VQSESQRTVTRIQCTRNDTNRAQRGRTGWRTELNHELVAALGQLVRHHHRRFAIPALNDAV
jgi:hypothetical protein